MTRCGALTGLCVLVVLLQTHRAPAEEPRRPNIVFVLVDDIGYADFGCTGAKDIKTPHIDRLAKDGVRFTDFYANAPVCTPTRAAFLTGRWQQRVGLEWALGFTAEQFRRVEGKWIEEPNKLALGLPASETSVARLLKDAGYATAAYGKWHLGFQREYSPNRHGFDKYFGVLLGHADYYDHNYFDGTHCLYENEKPVKVDCYITDLLNRRAVEFIQGQGKKPFFLYVPHLACHYPFQPPNRPKPTLTKENIYTGTRKDYAAMLERVDEGIGQMLESLEKNGVLENTLFIVSSDNGGERLSDNSPLFHHKTSLWEGGIRVPCVMHWPGKLPKGKVVSQPAITMDLTASILAAAQVEPPKERPLDGINLLPILTGDQKEISRTFFWRVNHSGRSQKAVRHGSWKYVQDGMVEMLFDLDQDVGERKDLAFRQPETLVKLKRLLADWESDLDRHPSAFLVR